MKKYISLEKQTIVLAALAWFAPFFVSFFLIDPETKLTTINPVLFKIVMFVMLAIVTFCAYKKINTKANLSVRTPNTFLLINTVLDVGVLILLFNVVFLVWVATILPIYIIVFYGMFFLVKKYAIH